MSNIAIRKQDDDKPAAAPAASWDPWRAMRALAAWDPFREIAFPSSPEVGFALTAAFDVKETKDAYEFKADVPGVKESDLNVTVTGNRMTISGKREAEKQEQTDTYYTYERSYGDFTRAFTLPEGVDMNSVRADLKEGVLTLSIKKLPEAQPKKIAVQSSTTKS